MYAHQLTHTTDLHIQMKELKEVFAEGAASPEWQGFDQEVEERIGLLEKEFLLSSEPVTKQSVARFHSRRDALVIETQEKWLAIQQRRLALWQAFPQKADANDPDVRPLAQHAADMHWLGNRMRISTTMARLRSVMAREGIPEPEPLPQFSGNDVFVQHTRYDPHEHTPPQQPDPPAKSAPLPPTRRAAFKQHTAAHDPSTST